MSAQSCIEVSTLFLVCFSLFLTSAVLFLKLKRLPTVSSKEKIVNRELKQVYAIGLKLTEKQWPFYNICKD